MGTSLPTSYVSLIVPAIRALCGATGIDREFVEMLNKERG